MRHPSFFRVGTVFKSLWPEPAGPNARGTHPVQYGESVYVKIKWFVVVVEGEGTYDCTCL